MQDPVSWIKNAKFILLVDKKINYNNYFNLDAYQSVIIYSPIYSISEQIEIVYKLIQSLAQLMLINSFCLVRKVELD